MGIAAAVATLVLGTVGIGGAQSEQRPGSVSASEADAFVSITPVRVMDTRGPASRPFGTDETRTLSFAGHVPAGATGVAVTLTAPADASMVTYFTVWPTGEPQPYTSVLNPGAPYHQASAALLRLGTDQSVSIYHERGESHLVVDLLGYYVPLSEVSGLGGDGGDATGPIGPQGPAGAQGPAGTPGTVWYADDGPPSPNDPAAAVDGDYYLDVSTGDIWILDGGTWTNTGGRLAGPAGPPGVDGAEGAPGADGKDGTRWFSGAGDPTPGAPAGAVDGDYYLDTTDGTIWILDGGTWTNTGGANIQGPAGPPGRTTFLSGAQSATVTTVLGGIANVRAVLPLSGVVAAAVPATTVGNLLTIDAGNIALDVRQPLPVATTLDTITFRARVTTGVSLPLSTVRIGATLWVNNQPKTLSCLATPALNLVAVGDVMTCTATAAPVTILAGEQAAIVISADVTAGIDIASTAVLNVAVGVA